MEKTGAGEWDRTTDLRFTKPLLCHLSYAGHQFSREGTSGGYVECAASYSGLLACVNRRDGFLEFHLTRASGKFQVFAFGPSAGTLMGTCSFPPSALAALGTRARTYSKSSPIATTPFPSPSAAPPSPLSR